MPNKTALTIIVSIILTIIIISLVNVGTNIVLKEPEYEDFCGDFRNTPISIDKNGTQEIICAEDIKTCDDGTTVSRNPNLGCEFPPCKEEFNTCQDEYDAAQKPYNQYRYYLFAGIGFILLLVGLFTKENLIQLTGLASGGILVAEGIIMNFENEIIVFFSLLAILIIFGIIAYRIIKKYK